MFKSRAQIINQRDDNAQIKIVIIRYLLRQKKNLPKNTYFVEETKEEKNEI